MLTVIIPSIGRPTLNRALESLLKQTNSSWQAYVGFDAVNVTPTLTDNKISYFHLPKKTGGGMNFGGKVRNYLLEQCTTEWACFLDDDDSFRPDYVEKFYEELKNNPTADAIIFRMSGDKEDKHVIPPLGTKVPRCMQVGISFAVRVKFLKSKNISFNNSGIEDLQLLEGINDAGGNLYFSPHITYNVRY